MDVIGNVTRRHDALEGFLIVAEMIEIDQPRAITGLHAQLLVAFVEVAPIPTHGQREGHESLVRLVLFQKPTLAEAHKVLDVHAAHLLIALPMAKERPQESEQNTDYYLHHAGVEGQRLRLQG